MRSPSWLACSVMLVAVLQPRSLAAQLSDEQLFHQGRDALQRSDYINALADLFAYSQRSPMAMQLDPAHNREVATAIQASDKYLHDVIAHARQLEDENRRLREQGSGVGTSVSGLTVEPPPLNDPGKGPTSYRVVCRGGGDMAFRIRSSGFGLAGLMSTVEFRRSATAGDSGLAPGECSWMDRPIGAEEPSRICHRLDPNRFDLAWAADDSVKSLNSGSAPYIGSLVSSEGRFSFMVFNNGQGCMVQTAPFILDPRTTRVIEKVNPATVKALVRPKH